MPCSLSATLLENKAASKNRSWFSPGPAANMLTGLMAMLILAYPSLGYPSNQADQGPPLVRAHTDDRGNEEIQVNAVAKKPASSGSKIVLIGASYAQDWNLTQVNEVPVDNKGMSGQQTGEILSRFERDVVEAAPKAVIIWGFINDIFRGAPERIEDVKMTARTNIATMVLIAKSNGIVPIVATEVTTRAKKGVKEALVGFLYGTLLRRPSYQQYINTHVKDINGWLRNHAEKEGIILLDFEKVLSDKSGMRQKDFATEDGSHISESGYQALTLYLNKKSAFNQLIENFN